MLTKDDYKKYLDQLMSIEDNMALVYKNCFEKTNDENIKTTFNNLFNSEETHKKLVKQLQTLLS